MDKKKNTEYKKAVLVFVMLTFALATGILGIAIGDEQPNAEVPVLEISKTMISGDTTVPVKTRVYWELEIDVSYDDSTDLTNVHVRDTIPADIELINTSVSKGSTSLKIKQGAAKLTWTIGTMSPGDSETLTMWIATGEVPNQGAGKGKPKYHFTKVGEHILNAGASVEGDHVSGEIEAGPTDAITVYAEKVKGGRK